MDPLPIKKQSLDDMYAVWSKGQDSTQMQAMLDQLGPDIDKAVYAYSGLNAGPAVKTRAKLLAAKAIKKYAPNSGSSLRSWVYTQLQPLSRYSRELAPSPVPERAYQQISALKKYEAEFYENKGRVASDGELSDLTGMSIRQLNKIRGMDKRVFSEGSTAFSGDNPVTSQEITVAQNPGFQKDVLDTMYSSFTPQEQVILEHKLGYNNKKMLSNNDIAKKLRISPGRVSQLTTSIAARLDEYAQLNRRGL
jgi:DNA-directed RNA polymerase specialized sigma subunit